jgi:hypothetical protein
MMFSTTQRLYEIEEEHEKILTEGRKAYEQQTNPPYDSIKRENFAIKHLQTIVQREGLE